LGGVVFNRQLAYWKEQLADAPPVIELPSDRPRPLVQTFKGAIHTLALSRSLTEAIKALSGQEEVTMFMTLLASFAALLGYWSGEEDLVVGTDVANRNRLESEALIGLFVNQMVLRARIRKEQRFPDLLKQIKETTLGAYANQDLPFDKLVEVLRPERDLGRNPLFQVMFGFLNAPMPPLETAGLKLRLAEFDNDTSVFDLSLYLMEAESGMTGQMRYNTELFEASTIKRMGRRFETLLHAIAARSSSTIDELYAALEEDDKQERLQNRTEFAAARRKMFKGAVAKHTSAPSFAAEREELR
jgi:non-ribosomal peptide synthetase component F